RAPAPRTGAPARPVRRRRRPRVAASATAWAPARAPEAGARAPPRAPAPSSPRAELVEEVDLGAAADRQRHPLLQRLGPDVAGAPSRTGAVPVEARPPACSTTKASG